MILFGGIYEVTKELNDFSIFDFRSNKWITLFEETNSPRRSPNESPTIGGDQSPLGGNSPKKSTTIGSPGLRLKGSLRKGSPPKALNRSHTKTSKSPIKRNLTIATTMGQSRNTKKSLPGSNY